MLTQFAANAGPSQIAYKISTKKRHKKTSQEAAAAMNHSEFTST
jgi:hypothetical protein